MPRLRTRPVQPETRYDRYARALVAAGEQIDGAGAQPVIDVARVGLAEWTWHQAALKDDLRETASAAWPCETPLTDPDGAVTLFRHDDGYGVYRLTDGAVVLLETGGGWFSVRAAAASRRAAHAAVDAFAAVYPALYADQDADGTLTVPITFWVLSQFGPTRRLRRVETARWDDISGNYTAEVWDAVAGLVDGFTPGETGQLLLWHGPPGTGKTWALRALAHEWRDWAEFHCITDPDAFFVKDAAYMVDVLLADSYEAIDPADGTVTVTAGEKWRVLVLEDTGELLSADAKEKSGQGLSRLLNVVDGMIGQGLRVLVLVTTNDPIETLHPAVTRAGRCASEILFAPLTAGEASEWLGRPVDAPMTLADLYAAEAYDPDDDQLDPLTQAAVDAASEPLPGLEDDTSALVAAAAAGTVTPADAIQAVVAADPLSRLMSAHDRTLATVERLVALEQSEERRDFAVRMAEESLGAVRDLAARDHAAPPAAPPVVNVTVPEQPVTVNVEAPRIEAPVTVNVPEQQAPVVNVAAPDTPRVDVHVAAPETPQVNVTVPEQPPPAAPVVHVHAAPPPTAKKMRVDENPVTGARTITVVDDDEDGY